MLSWRVPTRHAPTPPSDDALARQVRSRLAQSLFGGEASAAEPQGRYRLLETVGEGGFGRVYTAYDAVLERKVALKIVHASGEARASAMTAEARTLAKLAHPHVVQVFDVETLAGGDTAIAMEWLAGPTAASWQRGRSLDAVIELYLGAGRGLAAAHRVDIIHRDFKPANIVLGDDGRARVIDFGLAHSQAAPEELVADRISLSLAVADLVESSDTDDDSGDTAGTPPYMAPEQHLGQRASAASDQYAFCVSLWQATTGELPFAQTSIIELVDEKFDEARLARQAAQLALPGGLQRILLKGLRVDPRRRYASMELLLDELEGFARRHRRRWWMRACGVGLVAGLGFAGYFVHNSSAHAQAVSQCRAEMGEAANMTRWSLPELSKAKHPGLVTTLRRFAQWSSSWASARDRACSAGMLPGRGLVVPLALQQRACLRRHNRHARGLIEGLESETPAQAGVSGPKASESLGDPQLCLIERPNRVARMLPSEPESAARVEGLRAELVDSEVMHALGRYAPAFEGARAIEAEALEIGFPALVVQASALAGHTADYAGDREHAAASFERAAQWAQRVGDDQAFVDAAIALIWVYGETFHEFELARTWSFLARGALEGLARASEAHVQRAWGRLESHVGAVAFTRGRYEQALEHHEAALEHYRRGYGKGHERLARVRTNRANVWNRMGKFAAAIAEYERALYIFGETTGPTHPTALLVRGNLVGALAAAGRSEAALAAAEGLLELQRGLLGAEHVDLAMTLENLAMLLEGQSPQDAFNYAERALELRTRYAGARDPSLVPSLLAVARAQLGLGRLKLAQASARRADTIQRASLDADHGERVYVLNVLARIESAAGRPTRARALWQSALEIGKKAYGDDHPEVAFAREQLSGSQAPD